MSILIYHITDFNNLPSILESRGLMSKNQQFKNSIKYINISHDSIQDRRNRQNVPCGSYGTLHDYVPFYFAPRSPMLYTINRGNVQSYKDGQNSIIHLVVEVDEIIESEIPFVFTDGHAIMEYSDFYTDLNDLRMIDWDVMELTYWHDTDDDPNRKCRRQAEFLIYQFCPWGLIKEIGVINFSMQSQVQKILQNFEQKTPVWVYPQWYY
ncbi:type II toxin-antitoxin system toxin DNA ADP-ribosyl transferase DarT [Planktothrix paucivesiculata]|uniref:DarT domain-containing protein n=1 Tax=Planktothrix paucivesiculata PCC 9631 TaxID=671071 RepID=A0A7Z9BID8_9CYAN|nr:DUF4433 domain-containing protein [Planktothrix paucivesiculata]VXD10421.1 conserved hypothetical protein [Planktothrix paucivesiculata PCC 9631]